MRSDLISSKSGIAKLTDRIERYDFVTFPNGIFSSTIIAGVIPGAGLTKTLELVILIRYERLGPSLI